MLTKCLSKRTNANPLSSDVSPKIGLPRALLYHKYAPMWTTFFRLLGCPTVASPNTNRQILDKGIQYAIDENCLAVKIFLGHVHYLLDKVDYVFIPHIVSLHPAETVCVKLLALADIVRNTFCDARVLEYDVDAARGEDEITGLTRLGLQLKRDRRMVKQAVEQAHAALEAHNRAALDNQTRALQAQAECRVLLVSHAYITDDALMGKRVIQILRDLGVEIVHADVVALGPARELSLHLSTDCYWTYSKELLGGIETYRQAVDGIVFLMAFPCGPDALVVTLCQHVIHDKPLCVLNMDELQGDAGLKTRLESFVDILRLKKERQP
jgi:predicted nucleotide-binding protein (sugar kinase/HSP70/actin superfamily)